jgi:predicted Zn finger-like uncharacterized protein
VKYRTTCPQCSSVFRLGPPQLDAAAGWVQCGICGAAFDARASLLLEDGSPLPVVMEPEPAAPPVAPPAEVPAAPAAAPSAATEVPAEAATEADTATTLPAGIAQRENALDLPSIILIDPDAAAAEEPGPLPEIAPAAAHLPPMYPPPRPPAPTASAAPPATPAARVEYARPPQPAAAAARKPARGAARGLPAWTWPAASALLAIVLVAQGAYFLRDTVVSRLPQTRPAFEGLCAVLGCTLGLPRQLDQLRIVGSDLQTEAPGRLRLSLTLGNRAAHAQAWPMLVLTLTDQRDRPLTRRSFAPSEYLGDPGRIAAGIPPRSEQTLSLPLNVRDVAPMGFDLQLTY